MIKSPVLTGKEQTVDVTVCVRQRDREREIGEKFVQLQYVCAQ